MTRSRFTLFLAVFLCSSSSLAQDHEKFALSMFHFNVQYVAGGLEGFPSGEDDNPTFDYDDAGVQDLIIEQSFEPVLDLYLAHPDWKVTLEMQAYMVEVMMERHPDVLAKLKQMVTTGQAELVSFHWSDQLFLAYPRLDLERSHEIMDAVYQEAGLTPSGVVFCQEGQFGMGMAPFAAAHDRTILVLPKNLFRYQHLGDYDDAPPLYRLGGVDVMIGSRGFSTSEVEVTWTFFDDGELLATNGSDPYMGGNFQTVQSALDAYEQELTALEEDGFRIATVTEYVDWAREQGLEQPDLPPVLDGTWQPPSTNSMRRWLGGSGLVDMAYQCERDNQVLTGNVRARHWIEAAEVLVAHAEAEGTIEAGAYADRLTACWRDVLLAQVSDASGINPFVNEIRYGLEHGASALACANELIAELAPEVGGPYLRIDTGDGTVTELDDLPSANTRPAEPFFDQASGFDVRAPGRTAELTWEAVGDDDNIHRLTVEVPPPEDGSRTLEVVFPLALDGFYLTPGLVEDEVRYHPFSAFDFQEGRISLPVANGLVGIGDDLWLVKQTSHVHVAATFLLDGTVRFIDDTLDPEAGAIWVFWLVQGDEQRALELAARLNLHPVAHVETGVGEERGCGCGASGASAGWWVWLAATGLLLIRGRRGPFSSS